MTFQCKIGISIFFSFITRVIHSHPGIHGPKIWVRGSLPMSSGRTVLKPTLKAPLVLSRHLWMEVFVFLWIILLLFPNLKPLFLTSQKVSNLLINLPRLYPNSCWSALWPLKRFISPPWTWTVFFTENKLNGLSWTVQVGRRWSTEPWIDVTFEMVASEFWLPVTNIHKHIPIVDIPIINKHVHSIIANFYYLRC